jgi:hypothetical protein
LVSSPMLTSAVLCASRCRFLTLSTRRTGNPLIWSGRLGPGPRRLAASTHCRCWRLIPGDGNRKVPASRGL